ncbi:hypothetical protein MATL_G00198590 [Megalops atlanticus]|uniref:Ig-like domain-containing protein n=1 Tax=Megalops atlanticus TaxID=7932 RepID=A0A9D3PJR8_MEGAT|nr:hypothetical protein MATL_G00198590 [Megalops atlanticus]
MYRFEFHTDSVLTSALMGVFLALTCIRLTDAQISVEQGPAEPQLLFSTDTMKLWCRTTSTSYSLTWYRQRHAKGLEMLSFSYSSSTSDTDLSDAPSDVKNRIESKRTGTELTLALQRLQQGDSGFYYCASRDALQIV